VVLALYIILRNKPLKDFADLTEFALIILIAFMTTRTFVAEQNLALIFPLILFPELLRQRGFLEANRFWRLFMLYTVWDAVFLQFSFLLVPTAFHVTVSITTDPIFGPVRDVVLSGCAALWMILGWRYIVRRA